MAEEQIMNDNPIDNIPVAEENPVVNDSFIDHIKVGSTTYTIRDNNAVKRAGDTMTGTLNTPKICSPEVQVSTSTSSYATGCKLVYANDAVKFVFN